MTDRERVARALHSHRFPAMPWDRLPYVAQLTYLVEADVALAAMPTWRRIPGEVVEDEPPFDGQPVLLWWPYWGSSPTTGYWDDRTNTWSTPINLSGDADEPPPKHWMPLPAPPAGEVGVVAIGYANTATGGAEIDNAGIIRRAPGAVDMPAGRGKE